MENVMIDLETLDNVPGGVILSIGAVFFDWRTGKLGPQYYAVINTESAKRYGLNVNKETVQWWAEQSPEACQVLVDAASPHSNSLLWVLGEFRQWLDQHNNAKEVLVWSNGADFDLPFLACAYRAIGQETPWKFWNNRCFRTLKNMAREHYKLTLPKREGAQHNALDDAVWQAQCAMVMLKNQHDIQSLWETFSSSKAQPGRCFINVDQEVGCIYDNSCPVGDALAWYEKLDPHRAAGVYEQSRHEEGTDGLVQ
jgi:hypothetical protein